MSARAYYNDNDPFAAAWLRENIKDGLIPDGEVDERSIADVSAADLAGFVQCHFFAGIGGWPYALRLAGWADDRPVWTGSCPCQPFSIAGQRKGADDKRHLWPELLRLIDECRPASVFGEQVASKDGRAWLSGVRADLEALGYAVGAADLCAAGVGAPHIRQRLYWVGVADSAGCEPGMPASAAMGQRHSVIAASGDDRMANSSGARLEERPEQSARHERASAQRSGDVVGLADAVSAGRTERRTIAGIGPSPWGSCVFIPCADGKARRIEPSIFPLAHGVSNRVGTLRGAGNAIVPQVAAEFIAASIEARAA